jgi:hypothetical protein
VFAIVTWRRRVQCGSCGSAFVRAEVAVFLTESEANEVSVALHERLDGSAGYQGPGYHLQLEDGAGSELTIGVLDPK